jgi:succinate-semialdehyde dehydrogenase/glutarate-semialdehyde dehydrogenase
MVAPVRSLNPATGETIADYPPHAAGEIEARFEAARTAARIWRQRPPEARAEALARAASGLRSRRDALARLATLEMGKPIAQAEAEVEKCAWVCEHYVTHGPAMLAPRAVGTDAARSFVSYEPLGLVLAVMPWNFPYWQAFRCAAPALMAGNVVLLKHASNVTGCALAIEEVWVGCGLPPGAFATLLAPANAVAALIADPRVDAVSLTGSEAAGVSVGEAAGRALKPAVLELGGSDAFVVLEDADLEAALATAVTARVQNNGQSCIAAKRFIVVEPHAARFAEALAERFRGLKVGDPLDRATQVGPLARADLRDELHALVVASLEHGAHLLCGGAPLPGPGFFYAPTVLTGVASGMPIFDEESFGPVAPVIAARDEDDAVVLANRSRFGLGACVWTRDRERGSRVAARLEAGAAFVNGMVKSDPRLPFGGIKRSGFGRELAEEGLRTFVNVKSVWMA